jgi:predicted dehydrogenase
MTPPPDLRIAVLGYGVMGRAHSYAYRVAPFVRQLPCTPKLVVLTGRNPQAVEAAASQYGFEGWEADWRRAATRDDIDLVDICTPPGTHAAMVETAAAAGKAVLCEKPLDVSYLHASRAVNAVSSVGVLNAIGFNYRRLPAVSLMKRMIDEGAVGQIRLWRSIWLSDEFVDPTIPFDWRFDRDMGGTTITDLGSHLVDMARWMVGEVVEVAAQSNTFVTERPNPSGGSPLQVSVDDASAALVRFSSGASGTFEMARAAVRRPVDFTVEVNGSTGTLFFDYSNLNELWYGSASDPPSLYGLRRIRAEHETHPYAGDWWPIGQGLGYDVSFVNQAADLLSRWPTGPWSPDLRDGLRVQAVCEAIERAATEKRWVRVEEVEAGHTI